MDRIYQSANETAVMVSVWLIQSVSNIFITHIKVRVLGPVVQSIVSLTSSLRGQLVKCFMTL